MISEFLKELGEELDEYRTRENCSKLPDSLLKDQAKVFFEEFGEEASRKLIAASTYEPNRETEEINELDSLYNIIGAGNTEVFIYFLTRYCKKAS